MALAYDATSTTTANGVSSCSWDHVCSGDNRILVVGVSLYYPGTTITSLTYNGVALTQIGTKDGSSGSVELWYLVAPAVGTHSIAAVFSQNEYAVLGATSWTGADQSTPLGTFASATGTSTAPTVDVSSAAGEVVVDVLCGFGNVTATVGASQTQRWNALVAIAVRGAGSHEAGAGTVTMSWTLSGSAVWTIAGVPIKPGAGGGGANETTASEIWVIPARTEPFPVASGYTGEMARALATVFPHLLAWRVENGRFVWHDLGWLPAHAQLDAIAAGPVLPGTGVDPGIVLFGAEAHDGVILTALGPKGLGPAQRRYADPGGVAGTDSGVLFASRHEFREPHRLLKVRIWGENFQKEDTVRFAYRFDRARWYLVEFHGIPATLPTPGDASGLFLEWAVGMTDAYAWEPTLPVITKVDVEVEAIEAEPRPDANVQVPEVE